MSESLAEFFRKVTGHDILPFQLRYATAPFTSTLLVVPTGLGKTDTVLVPWLHAVAGHAAAPRRLAFVLPRRNLTEQVAEVARERVKAAGLEVAVLELMGGSSDNRTTVAPDRPAILVGTQDILLSRALNRGYARNPFRWPIDFALLHNDCLWVFDEVQLMGDGLATSTQLAAFRERFGVFGRVPAVWMSATAESGWLRTVDFAPEGLRRVSVEEDDRANAVVRRRLHARKTLERAPEACRTPQGCAAFAIERQQGGGRTLVIANTVSRAREIASAIRKSGGAAPLLIHSRFRPADRARHAARLKDWDGIIVATQVVEAGVDITVDRLITDAAPWSSMVQRFGRVNRYGEGSGRIWWVDPGTLADKEMEKAAAPYTVEEVRAALAILPGLHSAAPADLPAAAQAAPWHNVLRRADLLDLFDTSPDLSGNQLDVSRFIRSAAERDCYLAWREWEGDAPPAEMAEPDDGELCPVPLDEFRAFARKHAVFVWDFLGRQWTPFTDVNRCRAGMTAVTRTAEGGYSEDLGWLPASKAAVPTVAGANGESAEDFAADRRSWLTCRQSLRGHSEMVLEAMRGLIQALAETGVADVREELETAAAKHDWGKAHPVMQQTLGAEGGELLAKQARGQGARAHARPYFRHELASALAMLDAGDSDLAAYLAAAHHGRIRLTLRSMPDERNPRGGAVARGIWEGDTLPPCELAADIAAAERTLSLEVMNLGEDARGQPSWTERMAGLRDRFGPFRLAYLEMLLRAADERGSAAAEGRDA